MCALGRWVKSKFCLFQSHLHPDVAEVLPAEPAHFTLAVEPEHGQCSISSSVSSLQRDSSTLGHDEEVGYNIGFLPKKDVTLFVLNLFHEAKIYIAFSLISQHWRMRLESFSACVRQGPVYHAEWIKLLMTWWRKEQGHRWPWYWHHSGVFWWQSHRSKVWMDRDCGIRNHTWNWSTPAATQLQILLSQKLS